MSIQRYCAGLALATLLVSPSAVRSQGYTGTYVATGQGETIALTLQQDVDGTVRGELAASGMVADLQGGPEDPGISGTATAGDETYGFVAQLQQGYLYLKLFPFDDAGNPLYDYAQTLVFARQSTDQPAAWPTVQAWEPGAATVRDVYVNRVKLSSERVQQIERQYRTLIMDGRYWYDAACGAWGVEGGPTLGFVRSGLDLPGPMPADISGGGTGIFINGREIHVQDRMALQQIFGVTYPGRYWLDAQGNLGLEGGMAIANLATAMQAAARRQYGSTTGAGGTVASDGQGGFMFSGKTLDGSKSAFWYSGQ